MNLVLSRHGIWYSRFTYLLPSGKRKEIRKSLRTRCKRTANKLIQQMRVCEHVEQGPQKTVCVPIQEPKKQTLKLSKAIDLWLLEREREGLSKREYIRVSAYLKLLLSTVGNKPVNAIGREQANKFKDVLVGSDKSVTTVNNYLKRAKALFAWLATRIDDLSNPFEGLQVKQPTPVSEQRRAYSFSEVSNLLTLVDTIPEYKKIIILIALYTGMRQNEICQLYKKDIRQVDGSWVIDVNDSRSDQRLKSRASCRLIPISQKLIDIGLLDMASSDVDAPLFPELTYSSLLGRARYFTRWFGRWRKVNNLPEFHSLRHTVATRLKAAGVPEQYAAQLLGHTTGSITYSRYGKQIDIEKLKPVVDQLIWSD